MNDYNSLIYKQDGGSWAETEVEGDRAIVKVKASEATIAILEVVFKRLTEADAGQYFRPPHVPRYDKVIDTIILDGALRDTKSLELLDEEIK